MLPPQLRAVTLLPDVSVPLPPMHRKLSQVRPPVVTPTHDAAEAALLASLAAIEAAVQERKQRALAFAAAVAGPRRDSVHGSSVMSAFSVDSRGGGGGGTSSVASTASRTAANPPPTYPRRPRYSVRRGVLIPLGAQPASPYGTAAPSRATPTSLYEPQEPSHHGGSRRGSVGSASVASDAVWVNPAAAGW